MDESGINETTKQYRIRKVGEEEWGAWQSSNIFDKFNPRHRI